MASFFEHITHANGGSHYCAACGNANARWHEHGQFYCNEFCAEDGENTGLRKVEAAARKVN